MNRIDQLKYVLEQFAHERDWEKFHTPKNMAMALSVECSELVEVFQWKTQHESEHPDDQTIAHIKDEIGDVMIYLTMIAHCFDIDPIDAAFSKVHKNADKYPIER